MSADRAEILPSRVLNFNLHGLVNIRLVAPPPSVVEQVSATFAVSHEDSLSDHPDVIVSFEHELGGEGDLRLIGLNSAAFDDRSFYLADGLGRRTRIDLDAFGEACSLECERGVMSIPLLLEIVSLRLLRKGHVLLHASAFVHDGRGFLATGWEKGGKTELLLAFMAEDAQYLSDEWTIVSPDGWIRGLGGTPSIWDWHARSLPQYWERLRAADRFRLRLLAVYRWLYRAMPEPLTLKSRPRQVLHRLSLEGGVSAAGAARYHPGALFGEDRVNREGAPIDSILFASVALGGTSARRVAPEEVAARMLASQRYERRSLWEAYDQFRFAFPERRNRFLEAASETELRLLTAAFNGRRAFDIRHPYPVRLRDLYAAARSAAGGQGPSAT